jgi:hypothetical protein
MSGRRRQEGSILLLAMMTLLVLAAIALVVVQNVSMGLSNAGAFRVFKQGYYVAEAGLTGPLAQAAVNQDAFMGFLQGSDFAVTYGNISPTFFDTTSWGSFGPEFAGSGMAGFVTRFSNAVDTKRVPGFSTSDFCYRKYTVTADGSLGAPMDPARPDTVSHTAQTRFVSQVFMGPFQCGF